MKLDWIKVTEQLPPDAQKCWVWNGRGIGITTYYGSVFLSWGGVTHWHPYVDPQPPTE